MEIFVPHGWELEEPFAVDYTYVTQAHLYEQVDDQTRCHVILTEESKPDPQLRKHSYIIKRLKQQHPGLRVVETSDVSIRNAVTKRMTVTWNEAGEPMKGALYFLKKGQRHVLLECMTSLDSFKKHLPIFDQIARKLEVR